MKLLNKANNIKLAKESKYYDDYTATTKAKVKNNTLRLFRNRNLLIIDIIVILFMYFVAFAMVFNIREVPSAYTEDLLCVLVTAAIFIVCLLVLGIYNIMWLYGSTRDYMKVVSVCTIASALSVMTNILFLEQLYFKFTLFAVLGSSVCILGLRMSIRGIYNLYNERLSVSKSSKRLMLVGAGSSATILIRDIRCNDTLNYNLICLIDDDPSKKNFSISGIKVMGNRNDIIRLAEKYAIDEIIISMPSASLKDKRQIMEICNETSCKIKTLQSIDQLVSGEDLHSKLRNVEIEDLLAREPIKLNNTEIGDYIRDNTILVTGGGGSIGSELCRQIMNYKPGKLVVLDIYENNAYDLQMELNRKYPDNQPEIVIASVRDIDRLEEIFEKYRPYIVFHAAAHKHVPLMEDSPGEAIKNNVFGTLNVVNCAKKYNVKRFVMISTDKAVNPTNIMGATKRICEMIVQNAQKSSKTEFVAVRFGNVLGSNGSVIPLFKKQISQGGPVTVTDKRVTRFFMTIPEAAQLVLQAASYAKGGEIFVLDMGQPVKIYDLAVRLIRLSGYRPEEDIKIEVCGLRPGEKLYEELLMDEEGLTNTSHNKIFIGQPIDISDDKLADMLKELKIASESDDNEFIKDAVSKAVPTYVRN